MARALHKARRSAEHPSVAKPAVRRRRFDPLYDEQREFWLAKLVRTICIVVFAYFAAVFFDLLLVRISELPHGALWDDSFRGPLFFILMLVVCVLLSIPYFMKEWDPGLRSFSMFAVVFLVGYAVFDGSGVIDPELPLKLVMTHVVEPLRVRFRV